MTTHQQGLRGEHHSARGRPQSPLYAGGSQSSGSHSAGAGRPRQDQSTPLSLLNRPVKITAAPGTHVSHPPTSPGSALNSGRGEMGGFVRNPSPARTNTGDGIVRGATGSTRRDVQLASKSLSTTAASLKDQLRLERELAALQKRFAMTDNQLTQSKGDLRTARSDLEKLRRDNEVCVSVSLLIFGGSIHGFIAP